MNPAPFDYRRPKTTDEAIEMLGTYGADAKLLAGGHSLLPLMKLRLAQPSVLVDLAFVPDLKFIRDRNGYVSLGPMLTHAELAKSESILRDLPLLAAAAKTVGDMQVRNRGTLGGSLAHGDPAGDLPAVALALGASVVVRGAGHERVVAAEDFFLDVWETALEPDEVIIEVRIPRPGKNSTQRYEKFRQRAGDWATVGVAIQLEHGDGAARKAAIALVNVAPTPLRASSAEKILTASNPTPEVVEQAAQAASEGISPASDLRASSDYKRHLVRVLTKRALQQLLLA